MLLDSGVVQGLDDDCAELKLPNGEYVVQQIVAELSPSLSVVQLSLFKSSVSKCTFPLGHKYKHT